MKKLTRIALLTGIAFGVPAAINYAIARQRRDPVNALPGDSADYHWPMGRIHYQVRGEGEPLVLIHGIGAGNSSHEFRRNFEALAQNFRVYALDLPGFGESERRDINYTADLYTLALLDFLRDVVGAPAAVVASSLSAAYAVRLAAMRPETITKLALLCPTGLARLLRRPPVWSQLVYGAFSLPAIGNSIYNGIASYSYIEKYTRENLYKDPTRATPAVVEHYYRSAHQPGGQYALRSFISGLLNADISAIYPELSQPILVVWGRHASMTPAEDAQKFLKLNPRTRLRIFENSRLLPHDEEAEDFNAAVTRFLTTAETPALSVSSAQEMPGIADEKVAPTAQALRLE